MKRAFIIVLDSFGIGEMPDADKYGDVGSNTIAAVSRTNYFDVPNMKKLGLFNIEGVNCCEKEDSPVGSFARMQETSKGKDTTIGHWEIAGVQSAKPLPTFPNGFPKEIISKFEKLTGRKVLCNKPYSGTKLLEDYGKQHVETGDLLVYTSADSVFQIAAHEDIVPVEKLYEYCQIARDMLKGENFGVGRVIARPFVGEYPNYKRTTNRHDFSLEPPKDTMLDLLKRENFDVYAVGKIYDIFAGKGITEFVRTTGNDDGMEKTLQYAKRDFEGLCFVNLVDFDMLYGHRNDPNGYARALTKFDVQLGELLKLLRDDDILIITADHGCDPTTASTDHSREYTPMLICGDKIKNGVDLKTRSSFSDISATVLDYFDVDNTAAGKSFLNEVLV